VNFREIKGRTYEPTHGKHWRDADWQVVVVFERARGFGEDAWIERLERASKRPGETADTLRDRLLADLGVKRDDVRLEAIDL